MDQITIGKGDTGTSPSAEFSESAGGVRSVQRAFLLMQCLTSDRPTKTLTEFAQDSGLAVSTVQRLLNTLEANALLRRLAGGHYTFGSAFLRTAVVAMGAVELHQLVEPSLERLSRQTGETANFAVLDETGDALYLRQSLSEQALRHAGWLGRAFSSEGTAIGAALAGQVEDDGAISTRKTLEPNVTAIAAPIFGPDRDGERLVVGAINVTGPTFRIDEKTLNAYRKLVVAEAQELSHAIGGQWPFATVSPNRGDK